MHASQMQFGIEIETVAPDRLVRDEGLEIGGYRHGKQVPYLPQGWTAERDFSIRCGLGADRCEIVSPVLRGEEGIREVIEVLETLRQKGHRVNASCGIHIHVGWDRNWSTQALARLVTIVSYLERALYAITGTKARERGRYAFGLVWIDAHGRLHAFKRPGAASDDLGDLELCRDCRAMLGHCRWATRGDPQDNRNNHPHPAGRGWLVHNGVVGNYDALVRRYRFRLRSDCDSEVFSHLVMRVGGSLLQRATWAVSQAEGSLAILGLWAAPLRMLVVRRGRPLAVATTRRGLYFASLPHELPASPRPVNDNFAAVFTNQTGLLEQRCVSLPPEIALC